MTRTEHRSLTLAITSEAGRLLVALMDGQAIARMGLVDITSQAFEQVLAEAMSLAREDNASEVAPRLTFGTALFRRFLPDAVREYLIKSEPCPLRLQLSEAFADVPWEMAFDGEHFLGHKFAIARQLIGVEVNGHAGPRESPVRHNLRLLCICPVALAPVNWVDDNRSGAESTGAIEVTALDMTPTSPDTLWQRVGQSDILRVEEAHLEALLRSAGGRSADGKWPPLLIIVIDSAACFTTTDSAIARTVRLALAANCAVVLLNSKAPKALDIERELLNRISSGLSLAESARLSRSNEMTTPFPVFYGDGDRVLTPSSERQQADDSHRQVSALFYDLVESTRLLDSIGGERYSDLLASCHKRFGAIVRRFGGVADDPRGNDGVMCYFGFPVAIEDSAVRAIRAGLEILEAGASIGVQLRIGISTGPTVIRDGQPFGTSVHRAARLQAQAEPGTLVVSDATLRLARDRFEAEALPDVSLKGIRRPGRLHRICGERFDTDAPEPQTQPGLTPLIGRETELHLLQEQWLEAAVGPLRVIRVSGEAGIGKSRLVREFRARLEADDGQVIECRCSSDHLSSAFHPVIDYLRRALAIRHRESDAEKVEKICLGLGVHSRAEAAWLIARLLGVGCEPPPGVLDVPSERLRERTLDVLVGWVAALASRGPLCVIVEDAHWIDPSSLEYLRRVITDCSRLPILMVMTERSGPDRGWDLPVQAAHVELRGLSPEQARQLVGVVSSGTRLSNQTIRALAERGDGIPLFIEESTRMMVDSRESAADEPAVAAEIPSTLQDLLTARLDALGNARPVAQLGATIGREFSLALLQAVLQHESIEDRVEGLPSKLRALVSSGMIIEKGDAGDRRYYFKHALLRDAAYQSLWERKRARLHRAIAEVIVQHFPELATNQPELMAYHFGEAHIDAEAMKYWERAARLAASRSANDEAISHVKKALNLIERIPSSADRDRAELRLLLLLAARLIAAEGYGAQQVESVYRRALAIARAQGDEVSLSKVQLGLEGYYFMRGDFVAAQKLALEAESLVAHGADPMARLQARWAVANILFHQGALVQAVERMNACLKVYESLAHRPSAVQDPGVMCLCYSAWGLWELGYPDQALERAVRVVELADALHHRFSMGEACGFRTTVHYFRGEFHEALAWAQKAIDICEDAGFVVWLAHALVMHGRVLTELGDADAGLVEMRRGYELWTDSGAVVTRPFYLAMQAESLAHAGRFTEGLGALAEALKLIDCHGERYYEPEIRRLQGRLLLLNSGESPDRRSDDAQKWFLSALHVAEELQLKSLALRSATDLAQLLEGAGRSGDAYRVLSSASSAITEGRETADVMRASKLLAQLRPRTVADGREA